MNNVAGLLATLGRPEEALPMFERSHEIYLQNLGAEHPRAVAAQLWIQQLSTPEPLPRPRPRSSLAVPVPFRRSTGESDRMSTPPPVIEESLEESRATTEDESMRGAVGMSSRGITIGPPMPPAGTILAGAVVSSGPPTGHGGL